MLFERNDIELAVMAHERVGLGKQRTEPQPRPHKLGRSAVERFISHEVDLLKKVAGCGGIFFSCGLARPALITARTSCSLT